MCSISIETATGNDVGVRTPEGPAGRHAEGGTQAFPGTAGVRPDELVQPGVRLAVGNGGQHRPADVAAHLLQDRLDGFHSRGGGGHASASRTAIRKGITRPGTPSTRTVPL